MTRTTKSMSAERQDAARRFVKRVVDERYHGNVSQAAKAIGVSQSMLYEFLNETRGPGTKLLEGVADLERVSIDDVIGRVVPGAGKSSSGVLRAVQADEASDPVPARGEAVHFARANGLAEEAIRRVQAMAPRELTAEQWYDRIKVLSSDIDAAEPSTAPPQTLKRELR